MKVQLKQVPITEVRKGMYVSKLDRDWLETPFLFQGFSISSTKEIAMLREYCDYVFIDERINADNAPRQISNRPDSKTIKTKAIDELLPRRRAGRYKDKTSTREELKSARKILADFEGITRRIFTRDRAGEGISIAHLKESVEPMVNSVIRNPDAMIWMTHLKSRDNYSYRHSMSSSVWAVSLGRQLGLPKGDLQLLALGTLLCDIGKAKIPVEILSKPGELTAREFEIIKQHVDYSMELLKKSQGVNEQVFEIVAHHHERYAGHGYPKRLKGDEIPIFSRIAAIADCYDAITSARVHAVACSPSVAIKKLYEWRNYDFQAELVEEFIQAIGIYPVGSLVVLSTGEVCVVIAEGRQRRLHPTVMQVLDGDKHPIHPMRVIDLQAVTLADDGSPLHIEESLEPGAYGIDPEELYL